MKQSHVHTRECLAIIKLFKKKERENGKTGWKAKNSKIVEIVVVRNTKGSFSFFCSKECTKREFSYVTCICTQIFGQRHKFYSAIVYIPCAVRYFVMNSDILELNLVPAIHFTILSFISLRLFRYRTCARTLHFYERNISDLTFTSTLSTLSLSLSFSLFFVVIL